MSVKQDFKAKEESVGSAVWYSGQFTMLHFSFLNSVIFKKIKLTKTFLLLNKPEVGFFWHTETADGLYQPQTFYLYMDFFPIIISVWGFNTSLKSNSKFLLSFSKMDIHFQTVILKFVFHLFSHDAHASDNRPVRLGFLFWVYGFFKSEFLCFST